MLCCKSVSKCHLMGKLNTVEEEEEAGVRRCAEINSTSWGKVGLLLQEKVLKLQFVFFFPFFFF